MESQRRPNNAGSGGSAHRTQEPPLSRSFHGARNRTPAPLCRLRSHTDRRYRPFQKRQRPLGTQCGRRGAGAGRQNPPPMRAQLRRGDAMGRRGVRPICPQSSAEHVELICNRIRHQLQQTQIRVPGQTDFHLTVSIGAAVFSPATRDETGWQRWPGPTMPSTASSRRDAMAGRWTLPSPAKPLNPRQSLPDTVRPVLEPLAGLPISNSAGLSFPAEPVSPPPRRAQKALQ